MTNLNGVGRTVRRTQRAALFDRAVPPVPMVRQKLQVERWLTVVTGNTTATTVHRGGRGEGRTLLILFQFFRTLAETNPARSVHHALPNESFRPLQISAEFPLALLGQSSLCRTRVTEFSALATLSMPAP